MKKLLKNIESHLQDEKSNITITALIVALDAKRDTTLPAVLKEKLLLIKETPLDENKIKLKKDEIEQMVKDEELDPAEAPIELLDAVFTIEEMNEHHKNGITLIEFKKLGEAIIEKVFSFKHLDEEENLVFKEIDSHKEMAVLSFYESKIIRKLHSKVKSISNKSIMKLSKGESIIKSISESKEGGGADFEKMLSDVKELNAKGEIARKELNDKAMEYSGLDKKDLTEWEQSLVIEKVKEMADDRYAPPMGKH